MVITMIQRGLLDGLKFYIDYLLLLLLSLLGLLVFSFLLGQRWGNILYSVLFLLVFFGLIYSRAWNTAKKDIKQYNNAEPYWYKGLIMSLPLLAFQLLIIGVYGLISANIIPLRDIVVHTTYAFPDNAVREVVSTTLGEALIPIIRLWFGYLIGFMTDDTPVWLLLLGQLVIPAAGFIGYFAGMKKFFLTDVIVSGGKRVKEKFNE